MYPAVVPSLSSDTSVGIIISVIMVPIVSLLVWSFRKMVTQMVEQNKDLKIFLDRTVPILEQIKDGLKGIQDNCLSCRRDCMSEVREQAHVVVKSVEESAEGVGRQIQEVRNAQLSEAVTRVNNRPFSRG
jgi:hypothetical protein